MKILAYDSSSDVLSAALFDGEKLIGEMDSPLFTRHSSTLAPSLDMLFRAHRMEIADVDVIAVGLGPGSFTGLRVGVATAKVLAYAARKKLVGVSSLEALVLGLPAWSGKKAVALDAKKGKYYAAVFEIKKGAPRLVQGPGLVTRERILRWKKQGIDVLENGSLGHPKASGVAKAAIELIRRKKFNDPFKIEPLYLHPRDCNVIMKGRTK
ncbi:MAG: tRNA (adenosine(37)-N6)-threonylcarbamoyltransferase complex dimerization subunit type 1 TsaB [Candidatus Omnitrophota bacterium]